MHKDLRAKRASIHHSEVPSELLANSTEEQPKPIKPKSPPTLPIDVDKIPKKPRTASNPNN